MRSLLIAAGAAVLFLNTIQPAAAASLRPVGKWAVDFGNDRCVAYRTFGSADRPVYLLLKPSPIGDVLQVQLAEKGINSLGTQEEIHLTIGQDEPTTMLQLQFGADRKQVRM